MCTVLGIKRFRVKEGSVGVLAAVLDEKLGVFEGLRDEIRQMKPLSRTCTR